MKILQRVFFIITTINWAACTIDGLSYMDPIVQRNHDNDNKFPRGEDPCNPLYWYPRAIPESCQFKDPPLMPKTEAPPPQKVPIPIPMEPHPFPIPAPMPYPAPMSMMPPPFSMMSPILPAPPSFPQMSPPMPPPPPFPPMSPPMPPPPPFPPMSPPMLPIPSAMPMPPLPYGIPLQPSQPMLPMMANYPNTHLPYPIPYTSDFRSEPPYGLVPPIPGLVSRDGGVNIMPFSDVYSDLLEKHKQKMIRKEMEKIVAKYNNKYRRHGRPRLYD